MQKTLLASLSCLALFASAPVHAQSFLDRLVNPNQGRYDDQQAYRDASQEYRHQDDGQLRDDRRRLRAAENRLRQAEQALNDEMNRRGMRD